MRFLKCFSFPSINIFWSFPPTSAPQLTSSTSRHSCRNFSFKLQITKFSMLLLTCWQLSSKLLAFRFLLFPVQSTARSIVPEDFPANIQNEKAFKTWCEFSLTWIWVKCEWKMRAVTTLLNLTFALLCLCASLLFHNSARGIY